MSGFSDSCIEIQARVSYELGWEHGRKEALHDSWEERQSLLAQIEDAHDLLRSCLESHNLDEPLVAAIKEISSYES